MIWQHEAPYAEEYAVPPDTAAQVRAARATGRRVIAVGTTVVRALESAARVGGGDVIAAHDWTELVVTPHTGARSVDGLLTDRPDVLRDVLRNRLLWPGGRPR